LHCFIRGAWKRNRFISVGASPGLIQRAKRTPEAVKGAVYANQNIAALIVDLNAHGAICWKVRSRPNAPTIASRDYLAFAVDQDLLFRPVGSSGYCSDALAAVDAFIAEQPAPDPTRGDTSGSCRVADREGPSLMGTAPEYVPPSRSCTTERSRPRTIIARFRIAPGTDGLLALHTWLDGLKSQGTIAAWYDGGTISDSTQTEGLVEFDTTLDRAKALSLWPTASGQPDPKPSPPEASRRPLEKALGR
jgi:hypothetical protein